MNRRRIVFAGTVGLAALGAVGLVGFAEHGGLFDDDDDDKGGSLIKSVGAAKVNLQEGLAASEQEGQPISGKLEVEGGKFKLSVYTAKDGKFSEVLVDCYLGGHMKVVPITDGDDLSAVRSQIAAMAGVKSSLKEVVEKAVGQNGDFRAVSVVPAIKDGHPAASLLLLNGVEFKALVLPLE